MHTSQIMSEQPPWRALHQEYFFHIYFCTTTTFF